MLLKLLILCAAICILMATAFVVLYFLGLIITTLKVTFQKKKKNNFDEWAGAFLKMCMAYNNQQKNTKEKKDEVEPK